MQEDKIIWNFEDGKNLHLIVKEGLKILFWSFSEISLGLSKKRIFFISFQRTTNCLFDWNHYIHLFENFSFYLIILIRPFEFQYFCEIKMGNKPISNDNDNKSKGKKEEKLSKKIPIILDDETGESKYFRCFSYEKNYFETDFINDLFLEYIDIKCTTIRSSLPEETLEKISRILLKNKKSLKGLKLPLKNQSSIGNIKIITETLLKLHGLKVLDINLQFSKMSDDEIGEIVKSLQTMKNLVEISLNISFTYFQKNSLQNLCILIGNLPNLCELSLEMEAIGLKGENYFPLLSGIKNITGLCSLTMRMNESDIGDEGTKILADSIIGLENLCEIELRINKNISNSGFDYLLNAFINKENQLTSIKLFFNLTSIENLNNIADVVKSQKYLTELILSFRGVLKTSIEAEKEIINSINNSLYLFTCIMIPSFEISYTKINNKAKVVPILQVITSQLRRKKFRKEIIEEIIGIIKSK